MTATQKHTPGPWRVLADPVWKGKHPCHDSRFVTTNHEPEVSYEAGEPHGWRFEDQEASIICTLTDAQEQKANARLIAAAPELLEACKAALITFDPMDNDHAETWRLLQSAIAHAEGKE